MTDDGTTPRLPIARKRRKKPVRKPKPVGRPMVQDAVGRRPVAKLRLPPETIEIIKALAARRGMSLQHWLELLVGRELKRLDDIEAKKAKRAAATARAEAARAGEAGTC